MVPDQNISLTRFLKYFLLKLLTRPIRLRRLLESHDTSGMTPLMIACHNGSTEMVKTLLDSGAAVNQTTLTTKRTALMFACMQGNIYLLSALQNAGADWTLKDSSVFFQSVSQCTIFDIHRFIGHFYAVLFMYENMNSTK
jgi:ankyrin repeat protein